MIYSYKKNNQTLIASEDNECAYPVLEGWFRSPLPFRHDDQININKKTTNGIGKYGLLENNLLENFNRLKFCTSFKVKA